MLKFQKEHPIEKRINEAKKIREKFPDRVPIIVENAPRSDLPELDKKKYLVPKDISVGQFVAILRKRITLPPEKAIFIFVNNTLPPTSQLIGQVDERHRDKDSFLYFTISGENTFGTNTCGF